MKKLISLAAFVVVSLFSANSALAQDSLRVVPSADVVSRYVWRGIDQGSAASVQPSLSLGYKGLTLDFWGSTSIAHIEPKEFDIALGYEVGGLSLTLTDYFWAGEEAKYGHYADDHFFELGLGYTFSKIPLTASWSTMLFCGKSAEVNDEGQRMYSTYINVSYDLDLRGVTFTPSLGLNPWTSQYADALALMDISLTATKEIPITERFSLPIFVQATVSPAMDKAYLVFGFSL